MKKSWRWAATRLPVKSRAAAAASGRGATGATARGGAGRETARGATTARGGTGPGTGRAGTGGELSVLKGAFGAKSIS